MTTTSEPTDTTRYAATVHPPDVRGWTWKQIVMGAANYVGTSIRELAEVQRQVQGRNSI